MWYLLEKNVICIKTLKENQESHKKKKQDFMWQSSSQSHGLNTTHEKMSCNKLTEDNTHDN